MLAKILLSLTLIGVEVSAAQIAFQVDSPLSAQRIPGFTSAKFETTLDRTEECTFKKTSYETSLVLTIDGVSDRLKTFYGIDRLVAITFNSVVYQNPILSPKDESERTQQQVQQCQQQQHGWTRWTNRNWQTLYYLSTSEALGSFTGFLRRSADVLGSYLKGKPILVIEGGAAWDVYEEMFQEQQPAEVKPGVTHSRRFANGGTDICVRETTSDHEKVACVLSLE